MALPTKDILKAQIIAATPPSGDYDQWADNIAQIILSTIQSAIVTVNANIPVSVSLTSGDGSTTAAGTGNLS